MKITIKSPPFGEDILCILFQASNKQIKVFKGMGILSQNIDRRQKKLNLLFFEGEVLPFATKKVKFHLIILNHLDS